MNPDSLSHLADHVLVHGTKAHHSQECGTTAVLLAHLAEMDERRLYLPAAYPSMFAYCVGELRMSEDAAHRRIRVARSARRSPAIFPALADGRLNITSVLLLAPYLKPHVTKETANELLAAAALKTKAEIEVLLAERFRQPDDPTLVQALADNASGESPSVQLAPEPVVPSVALNPGEPMEPLPPQSKVAPLPPDRHVWQLTVDEETQELLDYAQAPIAMRKPSAGRSSGARRAQPRAGRSNGLRRPSARDSKGRTGCPARSDARVAPPTTFPRRAMAGRARS